MRFGVFWRCRAAELCGDVGL